MTCSRNDDLLDRYLQEEIDASGTGYYLVSPASGARVLVGFAQGVVQSTLTRRNLRRTLGAILEDAVREVTSA